MISGQFPNRQWRPNNLGQARTVDEARAIATRFGIAVPANVDFFPDEYGFLDDNTYARGPRVTKQAGTTVLCSDLVHDKTGKVPFLFRPGFSRMTRRLSRLLTDLHQERSDSKPFW